MKKEIFLYLGIGSVLVLAGVSSWFLFKQSSRIKALHETPRQALNATLNASGPLKKVAKLIGGSGNASFVSKQDLSVNASPGQGNGSMGKGFFSIVEDYVITPYFIQDLANYLLTHYYPAGCADNLSDAAQNKISFKAINARYGLELIGLRHKSTSLEKARHEILRQVLNVNLIDAAYRHYADLFLDELVKEGLQTRKRYIGDNGEEFRLLTKSQVAEMLRMNSLYLKDVSLVFKAVAQEKALSDLALKFEQAEKKAIHANYVFNQRQNQYLVLEKEVQRGEQERLAELEKAKREKIVAAQEYKKSIRKRERLRKNLIAAISSKTGPLHIEEDELLYIVEWIQRRLNDNSGRQSFIKIAQVLDQLSQKFAARADALLL